MDCGLPHSFWHQRRPQTQPLTAVGPRRSACLRVGHLNGLRRYHRARTSTLTPAAVGPWPQTCPSVTTQIWTSRGLRWQCRHHSSLVLTAVASCPLFCSSPQHTYLSFPPLHYAFFHCSGERCQHREGGAAWLASLTFPSLSAATFWILLCGIGGATMGYVPGPLLCSPPTPAFCPDR